ARVPQVSRPPPQHATSLLTGGRSALAKQRGAETNARRALGDGQWQIAAHAHREHVQMQPRISLRPAVAPHAQTAKAGARHIFRSAPRSDGHEPARLEVSEVGKPFKQLSCLSGLRLDTGLRLLQAQLHLNQYRQALCALSRGLIQFFGQPHRIERINAVKELGRALGLVRLQMPDKMAALRASMLWTEDSGFRSPLLHAVFAKEREAQRCRLDNRRWRKSLRHSHQFYIAARSACRAAGGGDG